MQVLLSLVPLPLLHAGRRRDGHRHLLHLLPYVLHRGHRALRQGGRAGLLRVERRRVLVHPHHGQADALPGVSSRTRNKRKGILTRRPSSTELRRAMLSIYAESSNSERNFGIWAAARVATRTASAAAALMAAGSGLLDVSAPMRASYSSARNQDIYPHKVSEATPQAGGHPETHRNTSVLLRHTVSTLGARRTPDAVVVGDCRLAARAAHAEHAERDSQGAGRRGCRHRCGFRATKSVRGWSDKYKLK